MYVHTYYKSCYYSLTRVNSFKATAGDIKGCAVINVYLDRLIYALKRYTDNVNIWNKIWT